MKIDKEDMNKKRINKKGMSQLNMILFGVGGFLALVFIILIIMISYSRFSDNTLPVIPITPVSNIPGQGSTNTAGGGNNGVTNGGSNGGVTNVICLQGQRECAGAGYRICNYTRGIWNWSSISYCGSNKVCASGNCVSGSTNYGSGSGTGTGTCRDSDGSGYGITGNVTNSSGFIYYDYCAENTLYEYYCDGNNVDFEVYECDEENKVCSGGKCTNVGACTNECSISGENGCYNNTMTDTCGNWDDDSCREWGNHTICNGICDEGDCVLGMRINSINPEEGNYGTTVSLYGAGFNLTNNAVSFVNSSNDKHNIAQLSFANSTKILFTLPTNIPIGYYNLTIINVTHSVNVTNKIPFRVLSTCNNVCTIPQTQCTTDNTGYQTCVNNNGCFVWGQAVSCTNGCSNGACIAYIPEEDIIVSGLSSTSATVDDKISIYGSGFTNSTIVELRMDTGNVMYLFNASYNLINNTMINITIPNLFENSSITGEGRTTNDMLTGQYVIRVVRSNGDGIGGSWFNLQSKSGCPINQNPAPICYRVLGDARANMNNQGCIRNRFYNLQVVACDDTECLGTGCGVSTQISCIDYDVNLTYPDGKNYYNASKINRSDVLEEDVCNGNSRTVVKEYYCNPTNNDSEFEMHNCGQGMQCLLGRCVNVLTPSSSDWQPTYNLSLIFPNSGNTGNEINITGSDFDIESIIKVGSLGFVRSNDVLSLSSNEIKLKIPSTLLEDAECVGRYTKCWNNPCPAGTQCQTPSREVLCDSPDCNVGACANGQGLSGTGTSTNLNLISCDSNPANSCPDGFGLSCVGYPDSWTSNILKGKSLCKLTNGEVNEINHPTCISDLDCQTGMKCVENASVIYPSCPELPIDGGENNCLPSYTKGCFATEDVRHMFDCIDSDNGKTTNEKGNVSGLYNGNYKANVNDSCVIINETGVELVNSGLYLREGFCTNNQLNYSLFACPNGCSDGKCLDAPAICNENEGISPGKSPRIKGSVSGYLDGYPNGWLFASGDSCIQDPDNLTRVDESNYLGEFYCSDNKIKTTLYKCRTSCSNGACGFFSGGNEVEIQLACQDSDVVDGNGENYLNKGKIRGMDAFGNYYQETDSCIINSENGNSEGLKEYYCENNQKSSEIISCGQGEVCFDGACVQSDSEFVNFIDPTPANNSQLTELPTIKVAVKMNDPIGSCIIKMASSINIMYPEAGNMNIIGEGNSVVCEFNSSDYANKITVIRDVNYSYSVDITTVWPKYRTLSSETKAFEYLSALPTSPVMNTATFDASSDDVNNQNQQNQNNDEGSSPAQGTSGTTGGTNPSGTQTNTDLKICSDDTHYRTCLPENYDYQTKICSDYSSDVLPCRGERVCANEIGCVVPPSTTGVNVIREFSITGNDIANCVPVSISPGIYEIRIVNSSNVSQMSAGFNLNVLGISVTGCSDDNKPACSSVVPPAPVATCVNGVWECLTPASVQNNCVDSDGNNYNEKGNITNSSGVFYDQCVTPPSPTVEPYQVIESSCHPNTNASVTTIHNCESGSCVNGACGVIAGTNQCVVDSDCYPLGFTPGTCGTFYTCSAGQCHQGSAMCPLETCNVGENRCSGNGYQNCYDYNGVGIWNITITQCSNGCSDGSCTLSGTGGPLSCNVVGEKKCAGTNGYSECKNVNGVKMWVSDTCTGNQVCNNGVCGERIKTSYAVTPAGATPGVLVNVIGNSNFVRGDKVIIGGGEPNTYYVSANSAVQFRVPDYSPGIYDGSVVSNNGETKYTFQFLITGTVNDGCNGECSGKYLCQGNPGGICLDYEPDIAGIQCSLCAISPGNDGSCGDGICEGYEHPLVPTCPAGRGVSCIGVNPPYYQCADCGSMANAEWCGDNICNNGENVLNCNNDCIGSVGFCGDKVCQTDLKESANTCPGDCAGNIGSCPAGQHGEIMCTNSIPPSCSNVCVNDNPIINPTQCKQTGQSCTNTNPCCSGLTCQLSPSLVYDPNQAGICVSGGSGSTCNNNQICQTNLGENSVNCPRDCPNDRRTDIEKCGFNNIFNCVPPEIKTCLYAYGRWQWQCEYSNQPQCGDKKCDVPSESNCPNSAGNIAGSNTLTGTSPVKGCVRTYNTCPQDCNSGQTITPPAGSTCGNHICENGEAPWSEGGVYGGPYMPGKKIPPVINHPGTCPTDCDENWEVPTLCSTAPDGNVYCS